jgi:hypothetical protein
VTAGSEGICNKLSGCQFVPLMKECMPKEFDNKSLAELQAVTKSFNAVDTALWGECEGACYVRQVQGACCAACLLCFLLDVLLACCVACLLCCLPVVLLVGCVACLLQSNHKRLYYMYLREWIVETVGGRPRQVLVCGNMIE